jgi:hypothetical protein
MVDNEREAVRRRRIHAALDPQEPPGLLDALAKASTDVGERRDDDVPDRVVAELDAALEAVVEDLRQALAAGERDQAVAHVAGRRDPELLAERGRSTRHRPRP